MSNDKPSNSIQIFRKELDDILNTLLAISRYQYTYALLKEKKEELNIPKDIFNEFITPLEKFEERNFTNNYLFINVITILETYLKDRLIEELIQFPEKKEKLLKEYNLSRKLSVKDVLCGINPLVNEILDGIIYHNFNKVDILYKIIMNTKILEFISEDIWSFVKIRHELVHRSGNVQNKKILISEFKLISMMSEVSKWAENIDYYYRKKKIKKKHISFISRYDKHSKNFPHFELFNKLMTKNYSSKVKPIGHIDNEYLHL